MNKTFSIAFGAALALCAYLAPVSAADVGLSRNMGDPGYYGRIDLGGAPRPRIIYSQPVIVERMRVRQDAVYLHVRPGHARNWKRHCHQYNACGQRVYFVNDNWYETVYVDHHRQRRAGRDDHADNHHSGRRDHGNNGQGDDHGRGHGNDKSDR